MYRVIQWATGNIGQRALAASIRHPDLEVVGVRVYGADKIGVDAGVIAGTGTVTGVLATDDVDALVALDADCVLYMPSRLDLDELCRLLASGKNVVSTCSELLWARRALPADQVERLEQACAEGDVSLFATGSSPGFISEVVPIALLLLERRVDRIVIEEFANMSQRPSPKLLFEVMGFGREPGPVDERRAAPHARQLRPAARGARRTRRHPDRPGRGARGGRGDDASTSPSRPARSARASVAAQRTIVAAMDGDRRAARVPGHLVLLHRRSTTTGTLGETGWRVTVEGDAPLKVDIAFPVELDHLASVTPGLTAHPAVNAVVAVCEAPTGSASPAPTSASSSPTSPDGPTHPGRARVTRVTRQLRSSLISTTFFGLQLKVPAFFGKVRTSLPFFTCVITMQSGCRCSATLVGAHDPVGVELGLLLQRVEQRLAVERAAVGRRLADRVLEQQRGEPRRHRVAVDLVDAADGGDQLLQRRVELVLRVEGQRRDHALRALDVGATRLRGTACE